MRERCDVVIAETDPPILGALGAILGLLWRRPFVFYCQDIYPEVGIATGALSSGRMMRLIGLRASNWLALIGAADAVVVLAPEMAALLRGEGVPAERIVVSCPTGSIAAKLLRARAARAFEAVEGTPGKFVVMYAGELRLDARISIRCSRPRNSVRRFLTSNSFSSATVRGERITEQPSRKRRRLTNVEFIERRQADAR